MQNSYILLFSNYGQTWPNRVYIHKHKQAFQTIWNRFEKFYFAGSAVGQPFLPLKEC